MDVLLDTCAFPFLCQNDAGFMARARRVVLDPTNRCLLSIASIWEIAIKVSVGKIQLDLPLDQFIAHDLPPVI